MKRTVYLIGLNSICTFSPPVSCLTFLWKPLPQLPQSNILPCLWRAECRNRLSRRAKDSPHCSHLCKITLHHNSASHQQFCITPIILHHNSTSHLCKITLHHNSASYLCKITLHYTVGSTDQISIKTPNPKYRLFSKFASGVYLSEAPNPLPPPLLHTVWMHVLYHCTYSHKEGGGRWTNEKVRGNLVHKRGLKYQHDWLYLRRHLGFGVFIGIWSMVGS